MRRLRYGSAVGPDQISYSTIRELHNADPVILPTLFSALLELGAHPAEWKAANCVVVPKQGKPDYSHPKAYRPISLQSCFGKILETLVARRLAVAALKCGAISRNQMGGRTGHSAIDALMHTLNPAASALTIPKKPGNKFPPRPFIITHDIEGAFNNVRPGILADIMEPRKMPLYLTQ